jgi:hypothetical protein
MPSFAPGIPVLLRLQDVDGRDISAFTRVFNALSPAMTVEGSQPNSKTFFSVLCMQGPTPLASTM